MPRPKGKQLSVPKDESKSQKFVRLANQRIPKLLKSYRGIAQLGASSYESSPEQRKRIETVLKAGLDSALDGLNKVKSASSEFKL